MQTLLDLIGRPLSWPVTVLVLGAIFIFKFSDSIKVFLENVQSFKFGPFETQQSQRAEEKIEAKVEEELSAEGVTFSQQEFEQIEGEISAIVEENNQSKEKLEQNKELILYLVERAEQYEFAYLNLHLVHNSKQALKWVNLQDGVLKEHFLANFPLPPNFANGDNERRAILNALMLNKLVEESEGIIRVTEKGSNLLRSIRLA